MTSGPPARMSASPEQDRIHPATTLAVDRQPKRRVRTALEANAASRAGLLPPRARWRGSPRRRPRGEPGVGEERRDHRRGQLVEREPPKAAAAGTATRRRRRRRGPGRSRRGATIQASPRSGLPEARQAAGAGRRPGGAAFAPSAARQARRKQRGAPGRHDKATIIWPRSSRGTGRRRRSPRPHGRHHGLDILKTACGPRP